MSLRREVPSIPLGVCYFSGSVMGIRFYCPNGHRLHVKAFLAGKRGICPHCAARFRIPEGSEIPRGAPRVQPNSLAAATAAGNGARQNAGNGTRQMAGVAATAAATPDIIVAPADVETSRPAADPIAEAPDAVWYVRPPSGGQYGPAKGDVMQRWIAEGRVSADSLVWREGWPDWVAAGPIFPALNTTYTAEAPAKLKREAVSLQLQPAADPPAGARPAAVAARAPTKSLAAVIILGLIAVLLVAALGFVLGTRGG